MQTFLSQIKRPSRWFIALMISTILFAAVSCKKDQTSSKPDDVAYYTCTMHPSVKSQDPNAKCPICSMTLVPVMKKGQGHVPGMEMPSAITNASEGPSEFTVPVTRQQQIGVTYGVIEKRP